LRWAEVTGASTLVNAICGALAGAMTVDAAVTGACDVAESQTPVLGVAVPYAMATCC